MAGVLLVLGAVAVKERIEKKKAAKRMIDDLRYQELQAETEQRLSLGRTGSGESDGRRDVIEHTASEEEEEEREQDGVPPSYEQVVRTQSEKTSDGDLPGRLERKHSRRRSGIRKLMKFG